MCSEIDSTKFIPLAGYVYDYYISTTYPYKVYSKKDNTELHEFIGDDGYLRIALNDSLKQKHRVIALQFIPNPDNLPEIDHINRDKLDNRIENLRWCSRCDNQRNKSSYKGYACEYVDEIPDESIVVNDYNNHTFENYYFHNDIFYFYNGIQYRKLHINEEKKGSLYVYMVDTKGKRVHVCYSKFKKLYGLM